MFKGTVGVVLIDSLLSDWHGMSDSHEYAEKI